MSLTDLIVPILPVVSKAHTIYNNECTKVQNPRRHDHELDLSVYNTACAIETYV